MTQLLVHLTWEKEEGYWVAKASLEDPFEENDETACEATGSSRDRNSAIAYALEEIAKMVREAPVNKR